MSRGQLLKKTMKKLNAGSKTVDFFTEMRDLYREINSKSENSSIPLTPKSSDSPTPIGQEIRPIESPPLDTFFNWEVQQFHGRVLSNRAHLYTPLKLNTSVVAKPRKKQFGLKNLFNF